MHWNKDKEDEGALFQILDSELETDDKDRLVRPPLTLQHLSRSLVVLSPL